MRQLVVKAAIFCGVSLFIVDGSKIKSCPLCDHTLLGQRVEAEGNYKKESDKPVKYQLKPLGYVFSALEPFLDARTVEIHYTKHHQGYVDKLNAALEKHPELFKTSLEQLLTHLDTLVPEDIRTDVRNQGGGDWAHDFFWNCMAPADQRRELGGELKKAIEKQFGSFDEFKKAFSKVAAAHFGSGWCWLVKTDKGELEIISTPYHEIPQQRGKKPLLVVDVWEHAYYLKFQNRRTEYIDAWWNVVKWLFVEEQFLGSK